MKTCKKQIFEIEAVDLRQGNSDYGLVVACNKIEAKNMMSRKMSVGKRFIDFQIKKSSYKVYPKLPKKKGVY